MKSRRDPQSRRLPCCCWRCSWAVRWSPEAASAERPASQSSLGHHQHRLRRPHTISAGGHASGDRPRTVKRSASPAAAAFVAGRKVGDRHVTGGGTWQTFDPAGTPTAQGTYQVTNFVSFEVAPGAAAAGLTD